MFSLHTICFFRQDDGDAGNDDVSSDDNTDILSNCPHDGRVSRISRGLVDFYIY